jgi:hypothetical protein
MESETIMKLYDMSTTGNSKCYYTEIYRALITNNKLCNVITLITWKNILIFHYFVRRDGAIYGIIMSLCVCARARVRVRACAHAYYSLAMIVFPSHSCHITCAVEIVLLKNLRISQLKQASTPVTELNTMFVCASYIFKIYNLMVLNIYRCLFFVFVVLGLLCHCDICADRNDTCVTDGFCFTSTSLQKDTGVVTHAYRCVIVIFCKINLLYENMVNDE